MRAAVELRAPRRAEAIDRAADGRDGHGKELFAGLIHEASPRAAGPLVKVNCAALPETLLESELFGHERGAFTGADRRRIGRFEEGERRHAVSRRDRRTVAAIQAKLLRVLQDQEFHRVGGTRRCAPTRGSWRRPTSTSRARCGAARSARICSSGST